MIKERLLALPSEIERVKTGILELQEKASKIREKIEQWELEQMDDIANAVDDKGKAIFSNDIKRKVELEKRKNADTEYCTWRNDLKQIEKEIAILNIVLDKLYNEQGNLRAICRLEGGTNA